MNIKSTLSKGFALAVSLDASPAAFSSYDGSSWAASPCTSYAVDHAPTLVGYGTYHGKEVWVIKNSWGSSWGANGYLFTPIGQDNFCMEHEAYAIVPRGYAPATGSLFPNVGSHSSRGAGQLDSDNNEVEPNTGKVGPASIVSISVQLPGSTDNIIGVMTQLSITDVNGIELNPTNQAPFTYHLKSYRFPITVSAQ